MGRWHGEHANHAAIYAIYAIYGPPMLLADVGGRGRLSFPKRRDPGPKPWQHDSAPMRSLDGRT
jgi:hypothetical protein